MISELSGRKEAKVYQGQSWQAVSHLEPVLYRVDRSIC